MECSRGGIQLGATLHLARKAFLIPGSGFNHYVDKTAGNDDLRGWWVKDDLDTVQKIVPNFGKGPMVARPLVQRCTKSYPGKPSGTYRQTVQTHQ